MRTKRINLYKALTVVIGHLVKPPVAGAGGRGGHSCS